jgi:hypothetical protein
VGSRTKKVYGDISFRVITHGEDVVVGNIQVPILRKKKIAIPSIL